jgi:DNA-binding transcriptional MerR regulator/effector-binding domain-containing protein
MKKRFQVGEVSKIFSIPQSTLRYYDEIGLFKPKYIDQKSHYRYYTADQFIHLETIIFLRKIGFTIQSIQHQMKDRTVEKTYDLFQSQLKEVRRNIQELELTAEKIEHKMDTLKFGMRLPMHQTVTYKTYSKRPISFLYKNEPIDLLNDFEHVYVQELEHQRSGFIHDGLFTGDIGVAADLDSLNGEGPIMYLSIFKLLWDESSSDEEAYLPEGLYACSHHKGSYESIYTSYETLLKTLDEDGYEVAGQPIEIAFIDESVVKNQEDFITTIEVPIKVKANIDY